MPGPHDKIIADAAKSALGPLNFRRKGRSRTWLADHGWWLAVVEFQPSAWSKGSYLNVAAHWLWSEIDSLSFDFGGRVQEHVEYLSDAQFTPAASRLAEIAAHEAQRLTQMFTSLDATADIVLNEERTERHGEGGWMAYNAGVIAALVGRIDSACEMFDRVLNGPAPPGSVLHATAKRMSHFAADAARFKCEVASLIERQRDALKLPALDQPAL
jgi:hypothetical protein